MITMHFLESRSDGNRWKWANAFISLGKIKFRTYGIQNTRIRKSLHDSHNSTVSECVLLMNAASVWKWRRTRQTHHATSNIVPLQYFAMLLDIRAWYTQVPYTQAIQRRINNIKGMPIGSYILNVLYNSKCLDLPEPVEDSPQNEHHQLQQQHQQKRNGNTRNQSN